MTILNQSQTFAIDITDLFEEYSNYSFDILAEQTGGLKQVVEISYLIGEFQLGKALYPKEIKEFAEQTSMKTPLVLDLLDTLAKIMTRNFIPYLRNIQTYFGTSLEIEDATYRFVPINYPPYREATLYVRTRPTSVRSIQSSTPLLPVLRQ